MATTKKRQTNEQFLTEIMRFSRYGALSQAFVMEALSRYAEEVSKADPKSCDTPMLSGAAWVGVAKEIRDKLNEHLS